MPLSPDKPSSTVTVESTAMSCCFALPSRLNEFDGTEGGLATQQVLANSLLVIGLENLVGTKKAFVNFGRGPLLQGWHASLPRASHGHRAAGNRRAGRRSSGGLPQAARTRLSRSPWMTLCSVQGANVCWMSRTWSRSRSRAFPRPEQKLLVRFLEGAWSPSPSRESGNPRGIRMGPAGRLRLFSGLLLRAASHDAQAGRSPPPSSTACDCCRKRNVPSWISSVWRS